MLYKNNLSMKTKILPFILLLFYFSGMSLAQNVQNTISTNKEKHAIDANKGTLIVSKNTKAAKTTCSTLPVYENFDSAYFEPIGFKQ
jgi:hypothetical protein